MITTKPFNQSIIDALHNCPGGTDEGRTYLTTLGDLILKTTIEKDHELIKSVYEKVASYWFTKDMSNSSVSKKLDFEKSHFSTPSTLPTNSKKYELIYESSESMVMPDAKSIHHNIEKRWGAHFIPTYSDMNTILDNTKKLRIYSTPKDADTTEVFSFVDHQPGYENARSGIMVISIVDLMYPNHFPSNIWIMGYDKVANLTDGKHKAIAGLRRSSTTNKIQYGSVLLDHRVNTARYVAVLING